MFLRPHLLRRVAASVVFPALSSNQAAPLGFYRLGSSSVVFKQVPNGLPLGVQQHSEASASELAFSPPDVPLHHLTDKQLIKIIQRTVEIRRSLPMHAKRNPDSECSRAAAATTFVNVYLELRRRGSQSRLKSFPEVFVYIAAFCRATNEDHLLDSVIEDTLALVDSFDEDSGSGSMLERHYRALEDILCALATHRSVAAGHASQLHYTRVVNLCKSLLFARRASGVRTDFAVDCLSGIMASIISLSSRWDIQDTSFLEAFIHYIEDTPAEKFTTDMRPKGDRSSVMHQDLRILSWNFIRLIRMLLDKDMHDLVFSLLQVLLQKGVVPAEAVKSSGSEADFRIFAVSVLARWCALYGWPSRVLSLLLHEDLTKMEFREHHTILANDLLSYFLAEDAPNLQQCSQLLSYMLSQNPKIELENSLVYAFFKIAHDTKAARAAETLCAALQSASVLDRYMDGLFHGTVLPWLLAHLVYRGKNPAVGKCLAQELIRSTKLINPYQRGDVIALCAAGGYISETRALWERYTTGPERQMVTGHTNCMVGIVKLFKRTSDTAAKISGDGERKDDDMKGTKETRLADPTRTHSASQGTAVHNIKSADYDIVDRHDNIIDENPHSDGVPGEHSSPSAGEPEKVSTVPEADDLEPEASDASKTASDPRHGMAETALPPTDGESSDRQGVSEPVASKSAAADGAVADDEHFDFALRVLDAYRSAKDPLHRASHYDLNALARASDVLGIVRLSMQALQIIVDRKEVPDTRDLNIVIGAMAARDPSRAEEMLALMLEEDMHLDALSFSAVILGWLQHGNTLRASNVYSRSSRAGHARLSSKAANALLIACLDACCSPGAPNGSQPSREIHRTFLRQAYTLIRLRACSKTVITRDLGTRCVGAALRLEEADLAFYFWKQLLKTDGQRESDHDKELRQAVAVLVKTAIAKGIIDIEEGRRMIFELGGQLAEA